MSKHTPGPWAFAKYSAKRFGLGQRSEGAFFFLQCVHDNADAPVARADARLIAAAPDLLEALQKLCEAADESDGCQYGTLSTKFVRDIARAAIAKATGAA